MRAPAVLLLAVALVLGACEREIPPAVREQALKDNLSTLRRAIQNFRADQGRYPHTLQELVPRYVRKIPADPITQSDTTWRLTTEETVQPTSDFAPPENPTQPATRNPQPEIIDVHSGAPGTDSQGVLYSNY